MSKLIRTTDDYKNVFLSIENTLQQHSEYDSTAFKKQFDPFKHYNHQSLTDCDYFHVLVKVIFYSGFKAAVVDRIVDKIIATFEDFHQVALFTDHDIQAIIQKGEIIGNKKKIEGVIANAKAFLNLLKYHSSFKAYLDSFDAHQSDTNLFRLKSDLQKRFSYLGPITVFHFLTDVGFNVLKPDRVIMRIFYRLGLILTENDLTNAIMVGRRLSEATGYPIRYIDIILVSYGQLDLPKLTSICTTLSPKCHLCGVSDYCKFANGELDSSLNEVPVNEKPLKQPKEKKKKIEFNVVETDLTLKRYYDFVNELAKSNGMSLSRFPSDPTLVTISGGKVSLQFSIKPSKMVSVWQINDKIESNLPFDLTKYDLRNIGLRLNRRITFNLVSYGQEELNIISSILKLNKK
jgi:DNA-3-methyladenine glycosylase I